MEATGDQMEEQQQQQIDYAELVKADVIEVYKEKSE